MLVEDINRVVLELEPILESGDIIFRSSSATYMGLPFSRLVARVTKCPYSHTAIALRNKDKVKIVEINDSGLSTVDLATWLTTCYTNDLVVMRLKDEEQTKEIKIRLHCEVQKLSEMNISYDFTFDSPSKLYCTESVIQVYRNCNIILALPEYLSNLVGPIDYWLIKLGGGLMSLFGQSVGVSSDAPLWTPKNILSSRHLHTVYEHKLN